MFRKRWILGILGVVAVLGLTGFLSINSIVGGLLERFMLKTDDIIVERRPDNAYEQLFSYYVEYCTQSQWRRLDGSGRGNPFAHAVMYIKGACKDYNAPFPQLRRCRTVAKELSDPEHGAGVSVGRWFRNVNFVVVPGYELFYAGNLKPGETLTQAHLKATVRDVIDKGVFYGVELHPNWTGNKNWTLEEYVADQSIGTDFAMQFARNAFCARVPVNEAALDEVIAFLNDKNEEYATGEADYNWSLLANNCVHTLRNALAAANIWSPMSVGNVKIRHLFNVAAPANEFVNLGLLGAEGPLDTYSEVHRSGPARDALHDFGWLPTRHGALVKTLPVHTPNDVYETGFRLFVVQSPLRITKTQGAVRLLSDERFVELDANLRYFRDRYDAILAKHDAQVNRLASVRGTRFRRVERLHYQYIQRQRADVDAMLSKL